MEKSGMSKVSMRNKFLWFDLIVCSFWVLAILGGRSSWNTLIEFVAIIAFVMRLSFAFIIARNEKRAWIPLALMMILCVPMALVSQKLSLHTMAVYPLYFLNIEIDAIAKGIAVFCALWIWGMPIVLYGILLFRKKLNRTELTWADIFGGILWKERRTQTYSALMLICIVALYSGLAMDAKVCRVVCFVAPVLSFWLIERYYSSKIGSLWVVVVAMMIFFYAQPFNGLWRVGMLATSLVLVAYVGYQLYRQTKKYILSILTILYIGVLLPSLAIGYNLYTCIDYGRYGYYTCFPFKGIFYVKDGNLMGIRDRYGLLVKPEYESIRDYDNGTRYEVALCKNGYMTLYDIFNNRFERNNEIDGELQADVCQALQRFAQRTECGYGDRLEVKVTEIFTGKIISHVEAWVNGNLYYNYSDSPFVPEDTIVLQSGEFQYDTLALPNHAPQMKMSHVLDVGRDSMAIYRIGFKMVGEIIPEKSQTIKLVKEIAENQILKDCKPVK